MAKHLIGCWTWIMSKGVVNITFNNSHMHLTTNCDSNDLLLISHIYSFRLQWFRFVCFVCVLLFFCNDCSIVNSLWSAKSLSIDNSIDLIAIRWRLFYLNHFAGEIISQFFVRFFVVVVAAPSYFTNKHNFHSANKR